MAMIKKTAPGSTEEMKYIKNGKDYPLQYPAGTQRTSFTGSSDPRAAGPVSANKLLLEAPGLIDDGPVLYQTQNDRQPNNTVSGGPNAGVNKVYSASEENVDGGMGGTTYGPMKPFGASGSNAPFSNNVKR
tara:strand:- start:87 stop:479 length:393 start_codon:yes stop_codon:yes gene_type:complete